MFIIYIILYPQCVCAAASAVYTFYNTLHIQFVWVHILHKCVIKTVLNYIIITFFVFNQKAKL